MRLGIGLPTTVAGADPSLLTEWAQLAEARRFASLGAHDRLLYGNIEPLTALAAAAAVTSRIEIACLLAIAPLRPAALLAKQARGLEAISGGRVVLGLGLGARRDDYEVSDAPYDRRGELFERELLDLRSLWRHPGLGPSGATARPRMLLGGSSDVALLRLTRFGDGYVHSGGPARAFRTASDRVLAAWSDARRPGRPELWGIGYFALGPDAAEEGRRDLLAYYAFTGGFAGRIASGLLDHRSAVRDLAREYADSGCDHLVLFPTIARIDQVERLADALAGT